jgi:hypothetical protein
LAEHAVELDDVHRRHGQARAVDHAADVAIELDVGEVILAGFDFGVFLGFVAQRDNVGVTIERVRVEAHLATSSLPSLVSTSGLISSMSQSSATNAV